MSSAREPIFHCRERMDAGPAGHNESIFDFLNRVAGSYWDYPRQLMQEWANRIQEESDYRDLRQRFRSRDDEQFRSAFLELYLHECLRRAGWAVTIHPDIAGTSRRPDFLAERNGERLYVEAVAPGATPSAKAAASRRAVLFDTVNRLADPNFMLWLEALEEGVSPPAAAKLRADLRRWLAQLDPDALPDLEHAPSWRWQHDGWSATFKPIPKRRSARTVRPNDRAIGVYGHTRAEFVDYAPAIREALAGKHHAYGDLAAPFVVAVGLYIFDTDRWHSKNALYGQMAVQFSETAEGVTITREGRQADGYFGAPPDWRNRNVSAVLLVNQLMPYYVQRAETSLWCHPAPVYPLPNDTGLPTIRIELRGGALDERVSAISPENFFDLPNPWPPGEPWPSG